MSDEHPKGDDKHCVHWLEGNGSCCHCGALPRSEDEVIEYQARKAAEGFLPDESWVGTYLHQRYADGLAGFGKVLLALLRKGEQVPAPPEPMPLPPFPPLVPR
jgi:hypothetical protein